MVNIKLEYEVKYREEEIVKKLSEFFGRLERSQIEPQEKFDIFRSYFRGMQDGFFICLQSLNIEPTADQRPITEMRIDIIINNVEGGVKEVVDAWDDLDRELPLSRVLSRWQYKGEYNMDDFITKEIGKPLESNFPPYANTHRIKKLDDLPQKAAVHILRLANRFREKWKVDDFIENVLTITTDNSTQKFPCTLDVVECTYPERRDELYRIKKDIDKTLIHAPNEIGDIYHLFRTFAKYLFALFDRAHYFQDEPEYKHLVEDTIFGAYRTEIDPDEIKHLDDLTKNDAIRLIRVINSFRRKDAVDRFLSVIDVDDIYDLFSLYISYIFNEYREANYFLDEP